MAQNRIVTSLKRKQGMQPLTTAQIEPVMALGRQINEKSKQADGQPKRIGWRDALAMGDQQASEKTQA